MLQKSLTTTDLSGIIDKHDKEMLSSMLVDHSRAIYHAYESLNSGIPEQSTVTYLKYNAQTGSMIGDSYPLAPIDNIASYSLDETELLSESSTDLLRLNGGTDYSNKGIVGINFKINNTNYTGTGFIVGANKILTCAHCVFDTEYNNAAYNITIDVYENIGYI